MSEDRRRYLRDVLDELDRYFEEFEKGMEEAVRSSLATGQRVFSRPVVAGMAMGLGPEGKPTVQFFGDSLVGPNGFRSPIYEQVVDEKEGALRVLVELPGMEKEEIQISALEGALAIKAEREGRRYMMETSLQRRVDPESGTANYRNGLLEVVFKLMDKTNKGYRRVRVV